MRNRPPDRCLRWALRQVAEGARLAAVQPVGGGTSSAVHALSVDAGGRRQRLILRRYVRADWLASEPDLATREAEALRIIAGAGFPAPALIAVDDRAEHCDVPAILMTALPGNPVLRPPQLEPYLDALAEMLPAIHSVSLADHNTVRAYAAYGIGEDLRPPPWSSHPRAWERAIEVHGGPPPDEPIVFIHRDYHPGNILWTGGAISGVVDWANASRGPAAADAGHCRVNLAAMLGLGAADYFLRAFKGAEGVTGYDPYWDIASLVGMLPASDISPRDAERWDELVLQAVAELDKG